MPYNEAVPKQAELADLFFAEEHCSTLGIQLCDL